MTYIGLTLLSRENKGTETVGPIAGKCDKDIMIYLLKNVLPHFFIQTNSGQFKYSFISKKGCPHTLGPVMYLGC